MVSAARKAAYEILLRVDRGRAFAVDLLQGDRVSKLREVDRGLVTELVMGVLRWRGELDFEIERLSGKSLGYYDPEIVTILRMGVYQVRHLNKIPKASAVNEAVELAKAARKRSAAGLVNAVLRKCEPRASLAGRPKSGTPDREGLESARRAMPQWLLDRSAQHLGPEAATRLAWSSVETPPTTLRVSQGAAARDRVAQELAEEGVRAHVTTYADAALVVESGTVRSARAWQDGRVAIQDEASQLVGSLVAVSPGDCVLDLCAAPGIKTAQLASALGAGTLVAADLSQRRLRVMMGLLSGRIPEGVRLEVVRLDATQPLPFGITFDRILVDAPCSGTGTLGRNPEIKWRLDPADLLRLAAAQAEILGRALDALQPGGRLVYATCSLEPEENEQVVEKVLEEKPGLRRLTREELCREFPRYATLFDDHGYFRTRPDLHRMDGFFAAVMVRDP
ncbi:MAG TPA: 16S rRNA (cytosine(967)-C(5))-methyltransferase RsmB [Terriglobia bacterium]|nr:16S rRNA (cytosine(967)-C(5))-methyltransferase RsmB [Terriglobia bacterium]